jgi:GxxExxY protein
LKTNEITEGIIKAAIDVHRALGPGLLESAYEGCLCYELRLQNIPFQRQVELPVVYKGFQLDCGYRLDLLVAETVVVELNQLKRCSQFTKRNCSLILSLVIGTSGY